MRNAPSRHPHGELARASRPGGCERDPGIRDGHRCRQPGPGCPRAKRGAHPWRCPTAGRRHGPCHGGGRLRPGWAATCCAGTARRVGTPSAWGSRRPDVGAWQGLRGPEASLCAGPTSGTWHSGRAGGSEAETKQPSPWQCPPARDKCPQLGGEEGHKELLAGTGGTARATSLPGPGHVPRPGRRQPRRRHRGPCTPLLPKPPQSPGTTLCLMPCPPLRWDWRYALPLTALLPPCCWLRPASSCHVWSAESASRGGTPQPCF